MRGRSEKVMNSEVYSKEFKEAAVKKVIQLGPSKAAKELGLPVSTIFGWKKMYGMSNSMKTKKTKSVDKWTPEEKLDAVIKTATMDELTLGEFLRREGLFMANLEQWKTDLTNGLKSAAGRPRKDPELFELRKKEEELRRELKRKAKALAEFAARVVLLKKSHLLFGVDEDN